MVITLTGDNSFGLQASLRKIAHDFVAEHGDMALEQLDGDTADIARIERAAKFRRPLGPWGAP